MKTTLLKLMSLAVAFLSFGAVTVFATCPNATSTTCSSSGDGIISVYDYSKFSTMGSYSTVKDLVNNSETRIYSNMRITGHLSTDGKSTFIPETVDKLNGNGVTVRSEDIINKKYKEFNETGQLARAWAVSPTNNSTTYDANITYNKDGSSSVEWRGELAKTDENGNTTATRVGTTSKEHYAADGRIMSTDNFNYEGADGKTVYSYDNAQTTLTGVTTYTKNNQVASVTNYQAGRAVSQRTYQYDDNNKLLGSYTSATYNYKGPKLVSVTQYSPEDVSKGTTKVSANVYYDQFGRESYTKDSTGRTINQINYNDTGNKVTASAGGKSVTVAPGGITSSVYTTYNNDSTTVANTKTTYYYNGSQNYPAFVYYDEK